MELGNTHTQLLSTFQQLEVLHQVFGELDQHLQQSRLAASCVRCGTCCSRRVPVALMLEAHWVRSTTFTKPDLRQYCEEWLARPVQGLTMFTASDQPLEVQSGQRVRFLQEVAWVAAEQCPFLTLEHTCYLHDARPLACRAYGVTVPVDPYCRRPIGVGESDVIKGVVQGPELVAKVLETLKPVAEFSPVLGFFPTMMANLIMPDRLAALRREGRIADAKMVNWFNALPPIFPMAQPAITMMPQPNGQNHGEAVGLPRRT